MLTINNSQVYLPLGQFHLFYFSVLAFGSKYAHGHPVVHRFGTVLNSEVDLDKKRLGIGVMNGFIGGFAAIIWGSYRVIYGSYQGRGITQHIGGMNGFCGGVSPII